ncbi:unnamed protein product [Protopolystoma xenopodis]|uniref:Dynein regulatory complex subunit 7 n=1 Tax=Protopolystoma xenopodis TaxID=117903 RepID=A0A3S5FF31_9PLAT|nr:unnamed protein product [Protopolystoma xenopodis]
METSVEDVVSRSDSQNEAQCETHSLVGEDEELSHIIPEKIIEDEKDIIKELSPLYLPKKYVMLPDDFEGWDFPPSYKENTEKESRLLFYCENFSRQYAYLCRDRTRLFLTPFNECGIEKFVCTTIQPTRLPFSELYSWQGAGRFVSDFLDFVPLLPSTELPRRLLSPDTCMKLQKGTCFEYATLLCSLLLGVGYDAYVVCGYATRETCYMDESSKICPLLARDKVVMLTAEESEIKKYSVKPPKDLVSKYKLMLEARAIEKEKSIEEDKANALILEEQERDKPLPDPLYGLRVHAWILVLPGRREIGEAKSLEQ